MEILKKIPHEVRLHNKGFNRYLDTRFREGTNQKLERLLKREMSSLNQTNQDSISNPLLRLARRTAEYILNFGKDGIDPVLLQKTSNAALENVKDIFENGNEPYLAADSATAYLILRGRKGWSYKDDAQMKESLGHKIRSLLEDPADESSTNKDKKYEDAAEYAASYKLLFGKRVWTAKQEKRMIEATESEFQRFNSGDFPSSTAPLSSRAATLRILVDLSKARSPFSRRHRSHIYHLFSSKMRAAEFIQ